MAAKKTADVDVVEPTKVETAEEKALTRAEKTAFARYEKEIAKAADALDRAPLTIGSSLASIREQRLYRETHPTFDAYLDERWAFGRAYASRMISAAQTAQRLLPVGNIDPKGMTETQLRELRRAPKDEQQAILERLAEMEGEQVITAKVIKGLVQDVLPERSPNGQAEQAEPEQVEIDELAVATEATFSDSAESVAARAEQMAANLMSANPAFARALYEALGKALAADDIAF